MPETSVLLPSYQHANYLPRAVRSALDQERDVEVIVVDDGSTDGSRAILRELARQDPRVRCVFHERNEGIARTFNHALRLARGKYVGFLASDDAWAPSKLRLQVPLLEAEADCIVAGDARLCDASLRPSRLRLSEAPWADLRTVQAAMDPTPEEPDLPEPPQIRRISGQEVLRQMTGGNLLCLSTMLALREVVARIGFDETLKYANDFKLITELARKHDFIYVNACVLDYRIHGENASLLADGDGWREDGDRLRSYVMGELLSNLRRPTA